MLQTILWFAGIVAFYAVSNTLMKRATNINPTGWAFWLYDSPAFIVGLATMWVLTHLPSR